MPSIENFLVFVLGLLFLKSASTLNIKHITGSSTPLYLNSPSYDGKNDIHLLVQNNVNKTEIITGLLTYNILTEKFSELRNIGNGKIFTTAVDPENSGDIYFYYYGKLPYFVKVTIDYPYWISFENFPKYEMILGYTSAVRPNDSYIFIAQLNNSTGIFRYNFIWKITRQLATLPMSPEAQVVVSTDENGHIYILRGWEDDNYILEYRAEYKVYDSKVRVMNLKLPVDDLISGVMRVGNFFLTFSKQFELVVIHGRLELFTVTEVIFPKMSKTFRRFPAVFVEKTGEVYIFPSLPRKGSIVLTLKICGALNISARLERRIPVDFGQNNVTLECDIPESPGPKVATWDHEGEPKSGEIHNSLNLTLPSIRHRDLGTYTCRVESVCGISTTLIHLELKRSENGTERENTIIAESMTTMIITTTVIGITILGLSFASLVYLYWKYKKSRDFVGLTSEDIREFKLGNAIVDAAESDSADGLIYGVPYNSLYELQENSFEIYRDCLLGQGEFGIVYKGTATVGATIHQVAFKTTKSSMSDRESRRKQLRNLLAELKVLAYIGKHQNIISLVGAYTRQLKEGVAYVALEFCTNGSLELVLRRSAHQDNTQIPTKMTESKECVDVTNDLQSCWCFQIANGMKYLGSIKIIHSDLATRNILVAADMTIRISDFGLSRRLENYRTYVKMGGEPLPWRWMAVEALDFRNFSTQSDVWSYGVTVWEIYSMGSIPYAGQTWTEDFVQNLKLGQRLTAPPHTSEKIFNKMKECWQTDPSLRPTFNEIAQFFQELNYNANGIVYL